MHKQYAVMGEHKDQLNIRNTDRGLSAKAGLLFLLQK